MSIYSSGSVCMYMIPNRDHNYYLGHCSVIVPVRGLKNEEGVKGSSAHCALTERLRL